MEDECQVLREIAVLKDARTSVLLEAHCIPCIVEDEERGGEERRTSQWMTRSLWEELLRLVSPVAEGDVALGATAAAAAEGAKKGRREVVLLQGERLRLACVARRHAFDGLKVVSQPAMHRNKLVVGAALLEEAAGATAASSDARRLHQVVGARYDGEKISHYFEKK